MHRGAPTRVVVGSASRSAAASSAARSASRTRCRGDTMETNHPCSWGSSCDATSTARAGPSPACAVALSARPSSSAGSKALARGASSQDRKLKTGHRAPTVRDQHLDRVRIFVRAAAGLEVVRGAGYIPDDFEAPDRRRDQAPARQLPQDGRAARLPARRSVQALACRVHVGSFF